VAGANHSLVEEAKAALKSFQAASALVGPIALDRRRLLPFVVVGASVLGVTVGIIAGDVRGDARGALATGVAGGIAIGMVVGWIVLGLGQRVAGHSHLGSAVLLLMRILVMVPPYLAAGIGAWLVPNALTGAEVPVAKVIGAALTALLWGAVILFPLSFAMGRSPSGPVLRATTLRGGIQETIHESEHGSAFGRTSGLAIIAVVWFIGTILVFLSALGFIQSLDPARYVAAFAAHGPLVGPLILVAIAGTIVGGSALTFRALFEQRHTPKSGRQR
jgi:hypothetical protein